MTSNSNQEEEEDESLEYFKSLERQYQAWKKQTPEKRIKVYNEMYQDIINEYKEKIKDKKGIYWLMPENYELHIKTTVHDYTEFCNHVRLMWENYFNSFVHKPSSS
jgi:hypothetical protein